MLQLLSDAGLVVGIWFLIGLFYLAAGRAILMVRTVERILGR